MNTLQLGSILNGRAGERDAVHVAVIACVAGEMLQPGTPVNIANGTAFWSKGTPAIGIADPFIVGRIAPGQEFWVWIKPGTITSLRHVWAHQQLPGVEVNPEPARTMMEAIGRIQGLANELGISYPEALEAARERINTGKYLDGGSGFEGVYQYDGFWDDYAIVTGDKRKPKYGEAFFSCAC